MTTVYDDGMIRLIHGDAIEQLRQLDGESVDAIVTDPPYGLEFMGKEWDRFSTGKGFRRRENPNDVGRDDPFGRASARAPEYIAGTNYQAWCQEWATEAIRVLKPGGHLLSFGGTRTYHRLTAAIEDAGFEIRDCLVWGYASGFPKSHNLDGEWQGWGTALKPAWEPIVMARKPIKGTVAANVLAHGTGAISIDATRIPVAEGEGDPSAERKAHGFSEAAKKAMGATVASESPTGFSGEVVGSDSSKGRWPANILLTDDIFDGGYPEVVGGGNSDSGAPHELRRGHTTGEGIGYGSTADSGGKSRFFLVPKADRAEREKGLSGEKRPVYWSSGTKNPGSFQSPNTDRTRINNHPTVKPLELMRHLVRLVTPPNGVVVDPFVGSGTTAMAASEEGFRCIGIDQSEEYLKIAEGRLMATDIGMGLSA